MFEEHSHEKRKPVAFHSRLFEPLFRAHIIIYLYNISRGPSGPLAGVVCSNPRRPPGRLCPPHPHRSAEFAAALNERERPPQYSEWNRVGRSSPEYRPLIVPTDGVPLRIVNQIVMRRDSKRMPLSST